MTRRPRYSTYDDRKRLQFFSWFQRLRIILLVDWLIEDLMLHSRSRVQAVCIDPYMHGAAHWRLSQRKHEDKDLACKQTPDAVHSDLQTTAKDKASVHWQLRTHTHTHIHLIDTMWKQRPSHTLLVGGCSVFLQRRKGCCDAKVSVLWIVHRWLFEKKTVLIL